MSKRRSYSLITHGTSKKRKLIRALFLSRMSLKTLWKSLRTWGNQTKLWLKTNMSQTMKKNQRLALQTSFSRSLHLVLRKNLWRQRWKISRKKNSWSMTSKTFTKRKNKSTSSCLPMMPTAITNSKRQRGSYLRRRKMRLRSSSMRAANLMVTLPPPF